MYDDLEFLKEHYSSSAFYSVKKPKSKCDDLKTRSVEWEKRKGKTFILKSFLRSADLFNKGSELILEQLKEESIKYSHKCRVIDKDIGRLLGTLNGLEQVHRRSSRSLSRELLGLVEESKQLTERLVNYKKELSYRTASVQKLNENVQLYNQLVKEKQSFVLASKKDFQSREDRIRALNDQLQSLNHEDEAAKLENEQLMAQIELLKKLKTTQPFSTDFQNKVDQSIHPQDKLGNAVEQENYHSIDCRKAFPFEQSTLFSKGICQTCQSKNSQSTKSLFSLNNVDSKNLLSSKLFKD